MNLKEKKNAIEIHNLTKIYKSKGKEDKVKALDNVNLNVKKGEILGLLGPNGAGKTTMVSILTTLIQPTEGYATILGHNILKDPWYIKKNVGLMLGREMIYHRVTGFNNLKFWGKIYEIPNYKDRIYQLAEQLGLSNWLAEYVEKYSTGMRTKLAMIRALLPDPKILFLDEPMLGLDPNIVNKLIETLLDLNKTIFLTSHQMNIVERLCDRIAFLNKGKIIKIDEKDNFRNSIKREIKIRVHVKEKAGKLYKNLKSEPYLNNLVKEDNNLSFLLNNEGFYSELFEILGKYKITSFKQFEPDLEDVFIHLSSNN